jgi:hypothetical protein
VHFDKLSAAQALSGQKNFASFKDKAADQRHNSK